MTSLEPPVEVNMGFIVSSDTLFGGKGSTNFVLILRRTYR